MEFNFTEEDCKFIVRERAWEEASDRLNKRAGNAFALMMIPVFLYAVAILGTYRGIDETSPDIPESVFAGFGILLILFVGLFFVFHFRIRRDARILTEKYFNEGKEAKYGQS